MAPWMVITGLIVTGFVVLLIAPTIHRRINTKNRETAEANRVERAQRLQNSTDGESRQFDSASDAVAMRDRLLLRGVRAEVVSDGAQATLIFNSNDANIVDAVRAELGINLDLDGD